MSCYLMLNSQHARLHLPYKKHLMLRNKRCDSDDRDIHLRNSSWQHITQNINFSLLFFKLWANYTWILSNTQPLKVTTNQIINLEYYIFIGTYEVMKYEHQSCYLLQCTCAHTARSQNILRGRSGRRGIVPPFLNSRITWR